tara:strand:+ start:111 stop:401 length:291 start_codon:yes stop_codon:yes gene_type:complete
MASDGNDVRVDRLIAEVQQLTKVLKRLVETTPQRNKIWLTPSQIGDLVGVTYKQISRYRLDGVFRPTSYRKKGNRFEYHAIEAMKDVEAGGKIYVR